MHWVASTLVMCCYPRVQSRTSLLLMLTMGMKLSFGVFEPKNISFTDSAALWSIKARLVYHRESKFSLFRVMPMVLFRFSLSRYLSDSAGDRSALATEFSHENWVVAYQKDGNELSLLDLNTETHHRILLPISVCDYHIDLSLILFIAILH